MEIKVSAAMPSSGGPTKERSTFKPSQVTGKIYSSMVMWLHGPVFSSLSGGDYYQLLEAAFGSLPYGPLYNMAGYSFRASRKASAFLLVAFKRYSD